jgi:acetyl-CoA acetyltransferase
VVDKATGAVSHKEVTLAQDEGPRPDTTAEGLANLKAVRGEGKTITAGNASQLSDGASACVVMDSRLAEKRGLEPLGVFRGFAVAGCEPDEMGIGPVFAVPRLLQRHGLTVDDIDLWELNEAFAVQVIYCRDRLGIDPDKLTSTVAPSRSATPTACRGRGSQAMRWSKASAAARSASS